MKALFDFLPVILFFISYQLYGFYVAVFVIIIASIIQVLATRLLRGKFEKAQVIGLFAIMVFGGLTLWLRSPSFIMWKVTIINLLFALILLGSLWFSKKPIMAYILDKQIDMPRNGWVGLTNLWATMFVVIAAVNTYYVLIALDFRQKLLKLDTSLAKVDLQTITCQTDLCTQAKIAEAAWVNFKLFGSLGITVVFLILTAIYVQRHIQKN